MPNLTEATTESPVSIKTPPRFTAVQSKKLTEKKDREKIILAWKPKTKILELIKKKPSDKRDTIIVDCTPEMAMDILTLNDMGHNRYLEEKRIQTYANDLKKGNFPVNGDTITISKTYKVIDGQHRLWSIVDSGVTMEIIIVTGVEDKAMAFKDIGKNRSAIDMIVINDFRAHPAALAYAIKNIIYYESEHRVASSLSSSAIPNHRVNKFATNTKRVNELYEFLQAGIVRNKKVKWFSPAQWAFIQYTLWNLNFDTDRAQRKVDEFLTKFLEGADLSKNDPIKILRDIFIDDFKHFTRYKKRNRVSGGVFTMKVKFVFEAWNKWFKKEHVSELKVDLEDPKINTPIFR